MMKTGVVLAVMAVAAALPAQADSSTDAAVGACAAQADPQARLACYDAIAAKLKTGTAVQAPTSATAPPAPVVAAAPPQTPSQSFGMAEPTNKNEHSWYDVGGWFGGSAPPPRTGPTETPAQFASEDLPKPEPGTGSLPAQLDEITAKVAGVGSDQGRFTVTLDNGQVWRQVPGDSPQAAMFKPGVGDTVTISRGFMGSFNLSVEGHNVRYKVRRDS